MNEQVAHHIPPRTHRVPQATTKGASSSSSHRAGHEVGLHPEDRPYVTDEAQRRPPPRQTHASRPAPRPDDDEGQDDDAVYHTRSHSSVRRYAPAQAPQQPSPVSMRVQYHADQRVRPAGIPARSSAAAARPRVQPQEEEARPQSRPPQGGRGMRLSTLLLFLGVLLIVMLIGWMLLTTLLAWWGGVQDDWHYGRPRVERVTAVVDHGDSAARPSLFFAINDDGHAQVIECPAGDCDQAKVYTPSVLVMGDQGLTPVTLEFKDVNGDGLPDLLIHMGQQTFVYLNDHGSFRPMTNKDHMHLS